MTITSILEACEPTYRIEYRDRLRNTSWTGWRPLATASYLNISSRPVNHDLRHLKELTRRQADLRIKAAATRIAKDIKANGRKGLDFELRITPNNVWWPYPGAKSLRYA